MGMSLLEKLSPYMYDEKAVEEITNKHFDDLEIEELQRKKDKACAIYEAAEDTWKRADAACNRAESRYNEAAYALMKAKAAKEIPVAFNEYHTNHTHLGGAE